MGFIRDKIGGLAKTALDREKTKTAFRCVCSEEIRVPKGLAGRRGRCLRCDRPIRVPGLSSESRRAVARQTHTMMDFKVATLDPNYAAQGSDFYSSQLHTITMGIFYLFPWTAIALAVDRGEADFLTAVGISPDWPGWMRGCWLLVLFIGASLSAIPVAGLYRRFSGNAYRDDRFGFARAGGYDIIRWSPLVALIALFVFYWRAIDDLPAKFSSLRNPWIFAMLSAVLSFLMNWLVARRVFRARFGDPDERRNRR